MSLARNKEGNLHKKKALRMTLKDMLYAGIGLIISILLAIGVNDSVRQSIWDWISSPF